MNFSSLLTIQLFIYVTNQRLNLPNICLLINNLVLTHIYINYVKIINTNT